MDDETAALIVALHLEDLEELKTQAKGKGREDDPPSDAEMALRVQHDAFNEAETLRKDHLMAQSIGQAIREDSASIQALRDEESIAGADYIMANQMSGNAELRVPENDSSAISDEDFARLSTYNEAKKQQVSATNFMREAHLDINREEDDNDITSVASSHLNEPESLASAATRKDRVREIHCRPCVSCEDLKEVIEVPCRDAYCGDCLRELFTSATSDETLFPPRCCRQEIPLSLVADSLGPNLVTTFQEKAIEFNTLDRTYCHNPQCATFIVPDRIEGTTGYCGTPGCGLSTCTLCKKGTHEGDCSDDNEFEETIKLGEEAGWQRCERCRMLIELDLGCYHIT